MGIAWLSRRGIGLRKFGRMVGRVPAPAAAVLLAGLAATIAINWPGHIGWDGVIQLAEGRSGSYQNWHPAIMSWLLGITDAVWPGVRLFVLFDTLLLYGALISLVRLGRGGWPAAVVAGLMIASPQLAIFPGVALKDTLFACSGVAAFVCLAHAAACRRPRVRLALFAGGMALVVLAGLTRQNGILLVLAASASIGFIVGVAGRSARHGIVCGGGALAAAGVAMALISAALATHVDADFDARAGQIKQLRVFDIVGAVRRQPGLNLDELRRADPVLERLIRTKGVGLYRPGVHDSLSGDTVFGGAEDNAPDEAVARQWSDLVRGHPWLYLRLRAETFRWLATTPDTHLCPAMNLVGVAGPKAAMQSLGLAHRLDKRDVGLTAYMAGPIGSAFCSHVFFALLGVAALVFLLRQRSPPDIAMAAMLAASLAFMASFFVISIACDYRYLLFVDTAAMTAALYIALTIRTPSDVA
jgi:hypothetical protein